MWLTSRGNLSALLGVGDRCIRLANLGPGAVVGELALIGAGTRSFDIFADDQVEARLMT